eukprot:516278-Rhodomonas_salina.2
MGFGLCVLGPGSREKGKGKREKGKGKREKGLDLFRAEGLRSSTLSGQTLAASLDCLTWRRPDQIQSAHPRFRCTEKAIDFADRPGDFLAAAAQVVDVAVTCPVERCGQPHCIAPYAASVLALP